MDITGDELKAVFKKAAKDENYKNLEAFHQGYLFVLFKVAMKLIVKLQANKALLEETDCG